MRIVTHATFIKTVIIFDKIMFLLLIAKDKILGAVFKLLLLFLLHICNYCIKGEVIIVT